MVSVRGFTPGPREGIPGFAWLSSKNNPQKKFALTREKQKKTPPKSTKTQKKNTQKTPKKTFRAHARTKKPLPKSFRAYARKNNHLPGVAQISQKRRNFFSGCGEEAPFGMELRRKQGPTGGGVKPRGRGCLTSDETTQGHLGGSGLALYHGSAQYAHAPLLVRDFAFAPFVPEATYEAQGHRCAHLNTPREARRHNLPTCFLLNEAIFLRRALLAVVVVVSGRRLLVRGQFGRAPRGVSVGEDANARHVLPRAAATALARDRRELGDALDDLLDAAVLLVHNARRRELGPDGQRTRAQLAQRRDPPPRERVAALVAMSKGTMITTTVAMG